MPTIFNGGGNSGSVNDPNVNNVIGAQSPVTGAANGGSEPANETGFEATGRVNEEPVSAGADLETGQIAVASITDPKVPVVVFVGPPASGKSMILVRMAKYLFKKGFTITTDETFLNTDKYAQDCQKFKSKLDSNIALEGSVTFLLVDVKKDGRLIAKLLEAPGEDFFSINTLKNQRIEPYLSSIMTSQNPKTYVVLLDMDDGRYYDEETSSYKINPDKAFDRNVALRDAYSRRFLNSFYSQINHNRDRIVLLYNKIDATSFGDINGCSHPRAARNDARNNYPALFNTMKVTRIAGFYQADDFVFKTFCTGLFSEQIDSQGAKIQIYNQADDVYPRELWKEIIKKW